MTLLMLEYIARIGCLDKGTAVNTKVVSEQMTGRWRESETGEKVKVGRSTKYFSGAYKLGHSHSKDQLSTQHIHDQLVYFTSAKNRANYEDGGIVRRGHLVDRVFFH